MKLKIFKIVKNMFDDQNLIFSKKIFVLKYYFNNYFSPLNGSMRKGNNPEPDPY
jgi:hypothetical protein